MWWVFIITLKILSDDHCPPILKFFVQKIKLVWSNMSKIWFDLCPMNGRKCERKMHTSDPNSASPSEALRKRHILNTTASNKRRREPCSVLWNLHSETVKNGASSTTTPRLEIETLNRFEIGPFIPTHKQNSPSCDREMILMMTSSLYCI